ncbi:MAG: hypothetical protein QXL16_00165 [Candidatus Micrarchaeaceae archaeon]
MKSQSALEFLMTYSWAFIIIALIVSLIVAYSLSNSSKATFTQTYCYIEPQMPCSALVLQTNSTSSRAILIFSNNLGTSIFFSTNSFFIYPTQLGIKYPGICLPSLAPQGSQVICVANITKLNFPIGVQLNPSFFISYGICSPKCALPIYNTSGIGTTFASNMNPVVSEVNLVPSPAGAIVVQGTRYYGDTSLFLILYKNYQIYALPYPGYKFSSWYSNTSLIKILNASSQSTIVYVGGPGTLQANFVT